MRMPWQWGDSLQECISDGRRGAKYCMRESLLEGRGDDVLSGRRVREMIAAVVAHGCEVTNDAMWHVPQERIY